MGCVVFAKRYATMRIQERERERRGEGGKRGGSSNEMRGALRCRRFDGLLKHVDNRHHGLEQQRGIQFEIVM